MQTNRYKALEAIILFIIIPLVILSPINVVFRIAFLMLGFVYVVYVLLQIEKNKFLISKNIDWPKFWKQTLVKFVVIAILTFTYVFVLDRDNLFEIVRHRPAMWVAFSVLYCALSVYPQELIFRTFFFQRYRKYFNSDHVFILVNAMIFAFAHIIFKNLLVICITFIGGLLFAFTYHKTKSTLLVSIEHAIYGCWLYTIGMGSMLGFPT